MKFVKKLSENERPATSSPIAETQCLILDMVRDIRHMVSRLKSEKR
jgi:hypothetical protein